MKTTKRNPEGHCSFRRKPLKSKRIKDGLEFPKELDALVPCLREHGLGIYDFGPVFYVINKGQTGIHKVCAIFTNYQWAKDYLDGMDEVLRPYTEIRAGLMIEGPPLA